MRLISNTNAASRRSKLLHRNGRLNRFSKFMVAGRHGAVSEDDFYKKLERLSVQAGKMDKILATHVQRILICEAQDTVIQSYYQ